MPEYITRPVGLKNVAQTTINPATEDKQDSIITELQNGTSFSDSPSLDAFNRLRISSPHTLFDVQNEYDASPLFYENQLTGGGTVTHVPNSSSIRMSVGTASGDKVVRQTREYFRYIPGKSQAIIRSITMGATKANVRKRHGYFDANNGLFFEDNGTNFGIVKRTYTSGSVVDNRIAQSSFNQDVMDGSGASGMTLDFSKKNIFIIDFQWLGAGRVRFGIFTPHGEIVYFHEIRNANTLTVPYMTTPNLPMRSEIENTGTAASSTDMDITCSAVLSENSAESAKGITMSASNGITPIAVTTRRAILSIRPKATFNSIVNRGLIKDIVYDLIASTNNAFYEIVYNGALGGTPSWASAGASSIVEYDVAGTTVTGGIVLFSGFVPSNAKSGGNITNNLLSKLPLVLDIAGANPINLSVVCTSMSGTSNVAASLNWTEIY